ncbi:MAG: carbamoyltransferase HypF, partial [Anaerolineaceae bacterium]
NLLNQGKIIAIKGLGGFHIACDATNPEAVELLRKRKLRIDKPFAVMVPDISTIREHCLVSDEEAALLESRARPILILERLKTSNIVKQIAPNQNTIGMMLPYTPLHYLLLLNRTGQNSQFPHILVMTSGNLSEEPIAFDNDQARLQLSSIVDYYIMHNRPIHTRCDDSVVRFLGINNTSNFSRRSRGFAPNPIHVPWNMPQILATGAELKNTFCITRDHYAFVSHHIGDLENYETFTSFEEGIRIFENVFKLKPEVIAHDLHPNYLSSRYAIERSFQDNCPSVAVQHHHAHIASCMGENQIPSTTKVIGLSFDGTGYGTDGAIWGGEIFIADYKNFDRLYHLKYFKLPGGDMAIRNPARIAVAYLFQSDIDLDNRIPSVQSLNTEQISILLSQITHNINAPLTSSMGRLFDAVASIIGIRQHINYEAQAAIELEAAIDPDEKSAYSFDVCQDIRDNSTGMVAPDEMLIDSSPVLREVVADFFKGCSASIISAKFHNGIVNMILSICSEIRKRYNITEVVLSGGVWQNHTLLSKTFAGLEENSFHPIIHKSLPPNDGGISLGQSIIAYHRLFL